MGEDDCVAVVLDHVYTFFDVEERKSFEIPSAFNS
jgi:hypothetical protein